METKTCSKCKCEKPLDAFHGRRKSPDGKQGRCKSCAAVYHAEWAKHNPDKVQLQHSRWNVNPKKQAHVRKYNASTAGKAANAHGAARQREKMADSYIKSLLCDKTNILRDQVPRELIELKRLHLAIKRKLKDEQHHRPA